MEKKICSRKGCNEVAVKTKCRNTAYCWKHWRYWSMRGRAARTRKYVPTEEELEHALIYNNGMRCRTCGKEMVWHCSFSTLADVISLQHETDGSFSLICHSCNASHGPQGDKFYYKRQRLQQQCHKIHHATPR